MLRAGLLVRAALRQAASSLLVLALLAGCAPPRPVTLLFAGDVMLGRGVSAAIAEHGPDYPFAQVAPYLRSADLACANLEGPLTASTARYPRVNALRASVDLAAALQRAGFDATGLANNHAIDYGRGGLTDTVAALEAAGITPFGVGPTQAAAEEGAVRNVCGLTVGMVGLSTFTNATFVSDPERPSLLLLSEESLRRVLPPLRRRCELLVVSCHWGNEGVREVTERQHRLAHLAVDLGADVVVGHHAHVRGEIERYRNGLICYCLGNLVFDEQSLGGNEGWLLAVSCSRRGRLLGYRATPVAVRGGQALYDAAVPSRTGPAP